jgi:hypothetical protein
MNGIATPLHRKSFAAIVKKSCPSQAQQKCHHTIDDSLQHQGSTAMTSPHQFFIDTRGMMGVDDSGWRERKPPFSQRPAPVGGNDEDAANKDGSIRGSGDFGSERLSAGSGP